MKIFISADIEGVAGATHWDETDKKKPDYAEFREQMTSEVAAACEGATAAGAQEIWIKDAHDTGRNLLAEKLPENTQLIRGWSGHPLSMAQELDSSFHAMMMIGYHSRGGSSLSPLAHTMSGRLLNLNINGKAASEFLIHAYACALCNVPVALVSGDAGLAEEISELNDDIATVAVKEGIGDSTVSIHPKRACSMIREKSEQILTKDLSSCVIELPSHFNVDLIFKQHQRAYRASFYPGMKLIDPHAVQFETDDFFEVLRMLSFVTGM